MRAATYTLSGAIGAAAAFSKWEVAGMLTVIWLVLVVVEWSSQ